VTGASDDVRRSFSGMFTAATFVSGTGSGATGGPG